MQRIITLKKKPLNGKRDYRPRRVWSLKQKIAILARADEASTIVAAREFDVDIRLIFPWRTHLRNGELAQRTWKDPGRPKRKNRRRGEIDEAEDVEAMDE